MNVTVGMDLNLSVEVEEAKTLSYSAELVAPIRVTHKIYEGLKSKVV